MIFESGYVVSIDDDCVWVETRQTSACSGCSAKVGCGQGFLDSVFSGKRHYVKVALENFKEKIAINDQVEIAIPEHIMLLGSFWVYLLPLILMIAGAVLAQNWAQETGDIYSIIGAGVGLVVAGLMLRWHSLRHQANPKYQPVLHRIIKSASQSASQPTNKLSEVVTIRS